MSGWLCGRCSRGSAGRTPCACPYRRRTGSRSRGSAPSSAPGGASRTEPPLRVTGYAVRFSCTYREGSPRYRRAFSAYINSLYMRHADNARVSSAQPACGQCLRHRSVWPACGRCLRGSAPSAAPGRLEDGAPATHVRYTVEVQRCYRPSWRR